MRTLERAWLATSCAQVLWNEHLLPEFKWFVLTDYLYTNYDRCSSIFQNHVDQRTLAVRSPKIDFQHGIGVHARWDLEGAIYTWGPDRSVT